MKTQILDPQYLDAEEADLITQAHQQIGKAPRNSKAQQYWTQALKNT